jgi:transmembrane sensor
MNSKSAKEILLKYKTGQASAAEKALLEDWVIFGDFPELELSDADLAADLKATAVDLPLTGYPKQRKLWLRVAAAAAIFLVVGTGFYFYMGQHFQSVQGNRLSRTEVIPGSNKATLTLSDGRSIPLSSSKTGVVIDMAKLSYSDGSKIVPPAVTATSPENTAALNTVVTPRGGQYQVVLADGTKIWMNAGSELKFPKSFDKLSKREVSLNGEAYFEVAKNKDKPFIVHTRAQQVEVLGTHFNINSYQDEAAVKTTLLEGSVKVSPKGGTSGSIGSASILKPGQQAVLDQSGMHILTYDVGEAIAWKNGYFDFRNESLEDIMRKLSRWYDIDVVYAEKIEPVSLYGLISRSKNIKSVLKVLELSGNVTFRLEGRRLTVMNK